MPPSLARPIARQLPVLTGRLAASEQLPSPAALNTRLALAMRISREIQCYIAATIQHARHLGDDWATISAILGTTEASARSCWSPAKIAAVLASGDRHYPTGAPLSRLQDATTTGSDTGAMRLLPADALGSALTSLLVSRGLSLDDIVRQTEQTSDALTGILDGRRLPPWPVTLMLATALDGDILAVRMIWEAVQGSRQTPPASVAVAAERLHAALRGLHLVAGCPTYEDVARHCGLRPGEVRAVLDDGLLLSSSTVARLAAALPGGSPWIAPLWLDLLNARAVAVAPSADADGRDGSAR
ncbi:hypothetical protein [Streptomyces zagrosensis]|uniref:Uncharacterized protein n=1 Tax=Streptomyces zagrosensis TaxID=1042984 RepID=A0A7W9V1Y5_9ACTN|nr:hypothetical protein [Streptomyces zagrosensis]MBB5938731.1 hypothetical protein [Streptomyces zagrosensis]